MFSLSCQKPPHEQLHLRPLISMLHDSTNEPQGLYGEEGG